MLMKELRLVLKEMGVTETRSGNNFIFRKGKLATTVKQNDGCLWELDYDFLREKTFWCSRNAQTIINYFK